MRPAKFYALLLISLILCLVTVACANNIDNITEIRNLYQNTGVKIQNGELIETKLDIVANSKISNDIIDKFDSSGPKYSFYWSPNSKKLVFISRYSAHGTLILETQYLFYDNGDLVFIFEKTSEVGDKQPSSVERYYFKNNKLLRYMDGDKIFEGKTIDSRIKGFSARALDKAQLLGHAFTTIMSL